MVETTTIEISAKSRLIALLLCLFLGVFDAHRLFVGKNGSALIQILTLGGLGIWAMIDFPMILVGSFTDKGGRPLLRWM